MKYFSRIVVLMLVTLCFSAELFAQDDESRQATGLPNMIGENARGTKMNVSGRVQLDGGDKLKRRPVITVVVTYGGAPVERTTTNDTGFYVARNVPRETVMLIVEVDSIEVARQLIVASPMGNPRIDFTIPWPMAVTPAKPGVIYTNQSYPRTDKNEDIFQKAVAASNSKEMKTSVDLFNQILSSDPKDYESWTELGTTFFKQESLDNAEACYFKAIALKADYFVALINLGKLYLNRKQADNAIITLSSAVKALPTSADAQHYLGESYLLAKKGSLAVNHLNEALRLSPIEKADIHLRLAALYDGAKLKDRAAAEYKMFLDKRPDFTEKNQLLKYISDNLPK